MDLEVLDGENYVNGISNGYCYLGDDVDRNCGRNGNWVGKG